MSEGIEARLRDEFRAFLWVLWEHLALPSPTPIQYDIGEFLQNGPARRVVEAFRGVGKSWLTAAFVLWRLYRNPEERVLVVSANEERAGQFTTFCRRLIDEVEILRWLRPRDGQRDSTLAFDVGPSSAHQSPSLRAAGIFGQITGGRASLIVADDMEVPKNSLTQVMRDRLAEAIKEFDAVLMPGGENVYLGTPQTEGSIYNLLPERGYAVRIWPARFPAKVDRYSGRLAPWVVERMARKPKLVGKTTEPSRFTEIDLTERELSYGRAGFALQFMLDTSLGGRACHLEFNIPWHGEEEERIRDLYRTLSSSLARAGAFFGRPYGFWSELAFAGNGALRDTLKSVKQILDPHQILNPGRLCF